MAKIHTTIGIYPNGEYRINGVHEDDLQSHISYNKFYRIGRALVVDNQLVYPGIGVDKDTIDTIIDLHRNTTYDKATIPYQ